MPSIAMQGVTALHMAAQIGHEATAATLLKNGAPVAFDESSGCKVSINCLLISKAAVRVIAVHSSTTYVCDCLHALKSLSQHELTQPSHQPI